MPLAESKQVQRFYDFYRDQEIAFTKETLHYLRIDPRQIYVKCGGGQWPCIINSTSFQFSKIIVGTGSGAYQLIKKQRDIPVSVRYCFLNPDNSPLAFFVNGRVTEIKPFNNSAELVIITLTFSQQPPDDLILRLGQFIDTNENFIRRKDERILINKEIVNRIGLEKEETIVSISNVPRRCILRDISFGGAKVMSTGIPKFLENKPASLKLTFIDPPFSVDIPGMIRRAEQIEGRKDIVNISICFDADKVPMPYKVQINDFLMNNQKMLLELNKANALQQQQRQAAYQAKAQAAAQAAGTAQATPQGQPAQAMPAQPQMQQSVQQQQMMQMNQAAMQQQQMRQMQQQQQMMQMNRAAMQQQQMQQQVVRRPGIQMPPQGAPVRPGMQQQGMGMQGMRPQMAQGVPQGQPGQQMTSQQMQQMRQAQMQQGMRPQMGQAMQGQPNGMMQQARPAQPMQAQPHQ